MLVDLKTLKTNIREKNKFILKSLNLVKPLVLDILRDNDDIASRAYVQRKIKYGVELGITVNEYKSVKEFVDNGGFNNSNGVIVQLPCSKELEQFIKTIPFQLDVDNLNNGYFKTNLTEPTISGILDVIKTNKQKNLKNLEIVVIGQGRLVGYPLVQGLLKYQATVISCNQYTKNLKKYTHNADVIVSATGISCLIDETFANNQNKPQLFIDAGTCEAKDGSLGGDIDLRVSELENIALCPSPAGIGPLTVLNLFTNLILLNQQFRQ